MNNRKSILYILLTVLGLILVYNYMIAPFLMRYTSKMGMGMHWRMYNNTNYFVDSRFILIIMVVIAGLLFLEFLKPQIPSSKCCSCGKVIESDKWRICPVCGTPVVNKKG